MFFWFFWSAFGDLWQQSHGLVPALLRVAIGGMAILSGFEGLRRVGTTATLIQSGHWGLHLCEMLCGIFIVISLLMPAASLMLVLIVGWHLVNA